MGLFATRTVRELGESLVLAPERFDPRRSPGAGAQGRRLDELVELRADHRTARAFRPDEPVLVLDTSHAFEGVVLLRHQPIEARALGSAKRQLRPGDVIVSRLRPYLRQVAFVDEGLFALAPGGNAVCGSSEFFVLRDRDGFPAAALLPFLLAATVQAALAAGQEGGHHPRFSRALLGALEVPRPIVDDAEATARRVVELARGARSSLEGIRALVTVVDGRLGEP